MLQGRFLERRCLRHLKCNASKLSITPYLFCTLSKRRVSTIIAIAGLHCCDVCGRAREGAGRTFYMGVTFPGVLGLRRADVEALLEGKRRSDSSTQQEFPKRTPKS